MEKGNRKRRYAKRKTIKNGFPLTKIGGLAEIKEHTILFGDYSLHKSSEIITVDVKGFNEEYFESRIMRSIDECMEENIESIIKGKIVLPLDGNNNTDIILEACNMISTEVESVTLRGMDILKDKLYKIGKISKPIKSDTNSSIEELTTMYKDTLYHVFTDYFSDSINLKFSVANNGIKIKTDEVTKKIKGLVFDAFADALDAFFDLYNENGVEFNYRTENEENKDRDKEDELLVCASFYYNKPAKYNNVSPSDLKEQDLLLSLCNLYLKSKDFLHYALDPSSKPDLSPTIALSPIIKWCEEHIFPYNLEFIMKILRTKPDENTLRSYLYNLYECDVLHFKAKDFVKELRILTETTVKLMTISKIQHDKDDQDGVEVCMEICKKLDLHDFIEEYNKDTVSKKQMIEELLRNTRHIKLGLQYNLSDDTIELASPVDSVFDIAWNALIRVIAFYKYLVNENGKKVNLGICRYCGGFYFKYQNQEVCSMCQNLRNAQKTNKYEQEKKNKSNTSKNKPEQ